MDEVSKIREKIDLVAFITESLPLKKMGRNFKVNCPFHNEKSPSFVVSPERQIWHCFGCFPPGEKIKTPFGYHNIEEIDENHWVVSGKGNIRRVTAVMEHQYKGDLASVRIRKLGGEVRLTTDHSVFAIRPAPYMQRQYKNFSRRYNKYLKIRKVDKDKYEQLIDKYFPIKEFSAGDLQKGDLLLYPINRAISDIKTIDLSKYISKHTNYGPIPKKIPLEISVNDDFLKLLGYYIAEGSNNRAYIRFSLGNHEEAFAKEIVGLIKKIFGLNAKIYRRPTQRKTGLEITACHAKLANIFANLCGKGAANKNIPFIFQELPMDKQEILLNAIYKGDGTCFIANRSKNLHKSITTISKVLSEQIVDILLRLNLFPTLYVAKAKIDKLKVNHREAYSISWSQEAIQKYNVIYYHPDGTEYWLLPIVKLNRETYEGPVYNFTVDKDHSYIATNFAVANCGKGGDAFTFLMEYENIEFPEALRILAKRTGIELNESSFKKGQTNEKEKIFEINALSLKFYNYILNSHKAGKVALSYLQNERKLNKGVLETFSLGFAPNTQNALSNYLQNKKKFSAKDLIAAGVSIEVNGRLLDFFKNRIIFPLFDHRGNVTGFSGRALNDIDMPKYINTRETLAYHKGSMFFGFNLSKEEIKKSEDAVIVEGEFDVISLFMAGVKNTVAIKGTALTEDQVNLLSRFTPKITLCLDQDEAGFEATKRSLPIIEKKGLTTNVIALKDVKDPDEAVKKDPIAFKTALKQSRNIYDFLVSYYADKNKEKGIEGKKQTIQNLLPLFSQISNEIIKEHYIKKLSKEIDASVESIETEISKIQKKEQEKIIASPKDKRPRRETLEEYLLALIIQNPKQKEVLEVNKNKFTKYKFETPSFKKIIDALSEYFSKNQNFDHNLFINYLDNSLLKSFDVCFLYPLPKFETDEKWDKEIDMVTNELINLYVKQRAKEISEEINAVDDKESQKAIKLQEELSNLLLLIKKDIQV